MQLLMVYSDSNEFDHLEKNNLQPTVVQTTNGAVRGTRSMAQGSSRTVFVFLSIPYAMPPVGNGGRFRHPRPAADRPLELAATEPG